MTGRTQFAEMEMRALLAALASSVHKSDEDTIWFVEVIYGGSLCKNSGLERMSKWQLGLILASRMVCMDSAVWHGTVDFSTTILKEVAIEAICQAACSTKLRVRELEQWDYRNGNMWRVGREGRTYLRSMALPAPTPLFFVGALVLMKMRSTFSILLSTSRKEKVPPTCFAYCSLKARLYIDRKVEVWRVPSGDMVIIEVDNSCFNVGTFDCDGGASWTTCEY